MSTHDHLYSGERQVAPTLDGIRADHVARYEFAARYTKGCHGVLDAPCGVGYGTALLLDRNAGPAGLAWVVGIDACEAAIVFAREHYARVDVVFEACNLPGEQGRIPVSLVVCFEGLEHVGDDAALLAWFHACLEPGGLLIASVPNGDTTQLVNKWHLHRYAPQAFEDLLTGAGFEIVSKHSQVSRDDYAIRDGWDGDTLIAVCRKVAP